MRRVASDRCYSQIESVRRNRNCLGSVGIQRRCTTAATLVTLRGRTARPIGVLQ